MKTETKVLRQINREYILTSKEIKQTLQIQGEIISIGLLQGRSPNDKEKGKSADEDKWYISTQEINEIK